MSTRVLVTGGASGLGAAIVRALAKAGHGVDFTYRSSGEAAQALLSELRAAHPDRAGPRAIRAGELRRTGPRHSVCTGKGE